MRARMVGVDSPEWTALRAAAQHDVYDAPGYVSLSAWLERGKAAAVLVEHEDGRQLLVPLIIRDVDGSLRDASSPYGYPGILTNRPRDGHFVREAMDAVIAMLRDEGVVALFVRLHPLLPVDGLEEVGTVVRQATIAVDLSKSTEQIWSETRTNHRRDIRRALASGFEFSVDDSDEMYSAFQRIHAATMTRVGAANYYHFPKEYFDRLRAAMDGNMHLGVVTIDGQMAAGGLFTECCDTVQSFLIGTAHSLASQGETKLLYHGICLWAKERGSHWFHLGGGYGSDEDSLFHFKAGFSQFRTGFGTLRVVVRDKDYRTLVSSRRPGTDASDLTGYFPAYREPVDRTRDER